jgi:hypothetical protein
VTTLFCQRPGPIRVLICIAVCAASLGCGADNGGSQTDAGSDAGVDAASDTTDRPDTGLDQPEIVDMMINPSSLSVEQANGGDGAFEVTIEVDNFGGTISRAGLFIQLDDGDRAASNRPFVRTQNIIQIPEVDHSWFRDLEPDTYDIGARLTSDAGEELVARDLATVTLNE